MKAPRQVLISLENINSPDTMIGNWPTPFVGTHIRLWDSAPTGGVSWAVIPWEWHYIRFDAIDVLFIGPFYVNNVDHTFMMGVGNDQDKQHGTYFDRFIWLISQARSRNPNVKIIVVQDYQTTAGGASFAKNVPDNSDSIDKYATSVAKFINSYYNYSIWSADGTRKVSARLDGYEVDVEDETNGTMVTHLPKILTKVREKLDGLNLGLFTVSIDVAFLDGLDARIASSCNYVNMQRYDGGANRTREDYKAKISGLSNAQFVWGLSTEMPWLNAGNDIGTNSIEGVQSLVEKVNNGQEPGIWTWKVNSDNMFWANEMQVWLYNQVHKTANRSYVTSETVIKQFYKEGGRFSHS